MAIVRENARANIRFTNSQGRTEGSYSGIKPNLTVVNIKEFAGALEMIRDKTYAFTYMVRTSELVQDV